MKNEMNTADSKQDRVVRVIGYFDAVASRNQKVELDETTGARIKLKGKGKGIKKVKVSATGKEATGTARLEDKHEVLKPITCISLDYGRLRASLEGARATPAYMDIARKLIKNGEGTILGLDRTCKYRFVSEDGDTYSLSILKGNSLLFQCFYADSPESGRQCWKRISYLFPKGMIVTKPEEPWLAEGFYNPSSEDLFSLMVFSNFLAEAWRSMGHSERTQILQKQREDTSEETSQEPMAANCLKQINQQHEKDVSAKNDPLRVLEATHGGTGQKARRKLNIRDFFAGGMEITKWMIEAHNPFVGFISKGVCEKYIEPLRAKHEDKSLDWRIYDIAWMSSVKFSSVRFSEASLSGVIDMHRESDGVTKDRISTFTLDMDGQNVQLCKVYKQVDFADGRAACLIMLPEEAENFDIV